MFKVPLLKLLTTVFIAFFFFGNTYLYAQTISEDSLANKVQLYNKTQPNGVLYLTTDKTLYLPSEVIWFAAYLLDGATKEDSLKADLLSVTLLKENASVALRKSYLISNNFCSGSLTLPDTIAPGNYQLISCTNIVDHKGKPTQVFLTSITIKSTTDPSFTTDFDFLERPKSDSIFISTQIHLPSGTLTTGKHKNSIRYYFLNQKPRTARLDQLGTATIALPLLEVKASNHILYTTTTFNGSTKNFNLRLPMPPRDSVRVRFYPEGGDLVTGLLGRVAWESSSPDGRPAPIKKALLLENEKVLGVLQTDSLGTGLFYLLPKQNCVYTLKTINSDSTMPSQVFVLPKALPQGFVIGIADAVVNDTLSVNINASNPGTVSMAFTSMLTNASTVSPPLHIEKSKKIQLPLDHISKGLNTITLLDEQGRPIAERLFFAHFNSRNNVGIITAKTTYGPREKVTTNILLTDAQGKPLSGTFTVSCVQLNRLSANPKKNIEAYYYIEHWLKAGDYNKPITSLYQSKQTVQKLLLTKGWRRYTWQQLMQADAQTNAILPQKKLHIQGKVLHYNGPYKDDHKDKDIIKESLVVFAKHDSLSIIIKTDDKGYFFPKPEELVMRETSPPIRFQTFNNNKKSDEPYIVILADPLENLIQPFNYPAVYKYGTSLTTASQSSNQQLLKGEPFTHTLKAVEIKARTVYHTEGYGTNECGDYVCRFNFLNCPVHPYESDNYPPVKGHSYSYLLSAKGPSTKIIYQGCQENNMPGIYTAREFYSMDSTRLVDPNEKAYLSTLFWKPVVTASGTGKAVTEFNTSDLRGAYKITIEGVAANGELLYGEKLFTTK